jgi:hypothetical protein
MTDAVEFMSLVRQLPPERYRSLLDCIAHLPPGLSGDEKVRRIGIGLGHSETAIEQPRRGLSLRSAAQKPKSGKR